MKIAAVQMVSTPDVARNLERWVDAVMGRVYLQQTLNELAQHASIPVINGLSDMLHPAQLLADYQTIEEAFGRDLRTRRVVYIGDGNNLANSHIQTAALSGTKLTVATPRGYEPNAAILLEAQRLGADVTLTNDPRAAAQGAQVLYTDVWLSMGQTGAEQRVADLTPYALDDKAVARAAEDVVVLHCLPAHRDEEIAAGVLDGPRSAVWDQAENRLHAQKALLTWLLRQA